MQIILNMVLTVTDRFRKKLIMIVRGSVDHPVSGNLQRFLSGLHNMAGIIFFVTNIATSKRCCGPFNISLV